MTVNLQKIYFKNCYYVLIINVLQKKNIGIS